MATNRVCSSTTPADLADAPLLQVVTLLDEIADLTNGRLLLLDILPARGCQRLVGNEYLSRHRALLKAL